MKSAIIALCLVASAYAVSDKDAQVLSNVYEQSPEGNYQASYNTDNGISGQATGNVKYIEKDTVALEVQGSNSYTSPEGQVIEIKYVANENGFQAQGAHLPTPPPPQPIPEYIARAIRYIQEHPYVEKKL